MTDTNVVPARGGHTASSRQEAGRPKDLRPFGDSPVDRTGGDVNTDGAVQWTSEPQGKVAGTEQTKEGVPIVVRTAILGVYHPLLIWFIRQARWQVHLITPEARLLVTPQLRQSTTDIALLLELLNETLLDIRFRI